MLESSFTRYGYEDSNIPCKHTEYNHIINVARSLCGSECDDMSAEDVDELFLEKPLDEEDLVRILEESNSKSVTTGDTENYENVSNQNFSVDDVKYALHLANKLEMFLTKKDPCKERNRKFATQLNNCIKPYENYLDELQHRNEPSCSTATYSDEDEPSDVDIRPRKYPRIKTFLDDTSDED